MFEVVEAMNLERFVETERGIHSVTLRMDSVESPKQKAKVYCKVGRYFEITHNR